MSGGSWDYLFSKMDDAADELTCSLSPYRKVFGKQMKLMAKAMKDIEWVDSADMSPGDEIPSIEASLGKQANVIILHELIRQGEDFMRQFKLFLEKTKNDK